MATILIADDSPTSRKAITSVLEPMGHEIIQAFDGAEAWDKIQSIKPDIVILDILMPKIGGFELSRQIKSTVSLSHIGIIILTSLKQQTNKYWGLKQGADYYLTKPAHPQELKSCIETLMENNN
ncbi:response regulator [Myxococcota bacterium]|nr:response regulator [Myxococcota bacterium]MBU1381331.1 response regulator [Myxococcota bacterium]MBU1495708.1 response regulator [Myxococcota bacterium]